MEGITFEGLKEKGYMKAAVGDKDVRAPHAEGNFRLPRENAEFKSSEAANGNFVPPPFRSVMKPSRTAAISIRCRLTLRRLKIAG